MPIVLAEAFENKPRGLRLIVTSPALFAGRWLPDGFTPRADTTFRGKLEGIDGEVILRAAFVPRPLHVSGWGMTRSSDNPKSGGAPKPTRRLVAPGAVYFFDRGEGNSFSRADAEALWLRRIGLCTDEGFGRVVPGIWNPKGKS